MHTIRKIVIRILFFLTPFLASGQAFLNWPVEGEMNQDYVVVNYVDWAFNGIQDHKCLSKTYDGHQGTDFTLMSFPEMDSGHYVLAAASGRVTFVQDGLFDREKESVAAKGLGNYIAIWHPNKYHSYYGHLKSNSLMVGVGDSVEAGQRIAMIGSSGNSTDPHLHFELWYDSLFVVDPFRGNCGNPQSLWINEVAYDSSFHLYEHGMLNKVPTINELREREYQKFCCPIVYPTNEDEPLVLWAQMSGLRKGDLLTIQWYAPNDSLWFEYDFNMERDWWYYYFWSYINNGQIPTGEWTVLLKRNGTEILSQDFLVGGPMNLGPDLSMEACPDLKAILQENYYWKGELSCFDSQGKELDLSKGQTLSELPSGLYYIHLNQLQNRRACTYKWLKIDY
jgi:hypothetical protein